MNKVPVKKQVKIALIETIVLLLLFWGYWSFCYTQKQTTYDEISIKIENKETFDLIMVEEGCNYCENLNAYITKTKMLHPFHTTYICTYDGAVNYPLELKGLDYTPTIYKIKDGKVKTKAVGFAPNGGEVAIDNGEGNITKMKTENFWDFLSGK